jgi:hypothetical protein
MMISQIFESEEQGYKHYNGYAEAKGCSVRLDDKECHWEPKNLKMCLTQNEGYHLQKYFEAIDQKREPRALTRCGGKAMLEI